MHRLKLSVTGTLVVVILLTMNASADSIRFSNVRFSLGKDITTQLNNPDPLIAEGTLSGLGNEDLIVKLVANGLPVVTCTNQGGNQVEGRSSPKMSASGQQTLDGAEAIKNNGVSSFRVETKSPDPFLSALEYGCPNENWSAQIDFIFWTDATISLYDPQGNEKKSQDYTCSTLLTSVTCSLVK
jgi:hypothetical protein